MMTKKQFESIPEKGGFGIIYHDAANRLAVACSSEFMAVIFKYYNEELSGMYRHIDGSTVTVVEGEYPYGNIIPPYDIEAIDLSCITKDSIKAEKRVWGRYWKNSGSIHVKLPYCREVKISLQTAQHILDAGTEGWQVTWNDWRDWPYYEVRSIVKRTPDATYVAVVHKIA